MYDNQNHRSKIEAKIVEYLKRCPRGATISEISRHLNINRITLSKYLDILRVEGILDYKTIGRAKLWFINTDISILEILLGKKDLLKSLFYNDKGFIVLNEDHKFILFPSEIIQDLYLLASKYDNLEFVEKLGERLGLHVAVNYKMYSGIKEDISEDIIKNLISYLFKLGFGKIENINIDIKNEKIELIVKYNLIVEELSLILEDIKLKKLRESKTFCLFIKGYLKGLLENLTNRRVNVYEIECALAEDFKDTTSPCKFLIELK